MNQRKATDQGKEAHRREAPGRQETTDPSASGSEPQRNYRHRVVAGVLHAGGRVLLCHRRFELSWYPDVWDLPGGHVDDGETAASALVRELNEELGVSIQPPDWPPMLSSELDEDTHITVWAVGEWDGAPTNCAPQEHDRIGWFDPNELQTLKLADAAIADLCTAVLTGN